MVQGEEKPAAGLKHFQQAPCVPAVPKETAAQYAGALGRTHCPSSRHPEKKSTMPSFWCEGHPTDLPEMAARGECNDNQDAVPRLR